MGVTVGDHRAITDAAITLAAHGGVAALTHEAVDAEAGCAPGTASFIARTRQEFVDAIAAACDDRLSEWTSRRRCPAQCTIEDVADRLMSEVMSLVEKDLVRARAKLMLDAVDPTLIHVLARPPRGWDRLQEYLEHLLAAAGKDSGPVAAGALAVLLDGLLQLGAGTCAGGAAIAAGVRPVAPPSQQILDGSCVGAIITSYVRGLPDAPRPGQPACHHREARRLGGAKPSPRPAAGPG